MNAIEIKGFVVAWNRQHKRGAINLRLANGTNHVVKDVDPTELSVIMAILSESPAFLYEDGTIGTGWEQVG